MKQFTLWMQRGTQRPVLRLKEFYDYNAMLDTGALFPVWVEEENILNELGGTAINNQVEFGGFGGKAQGSYTRYHL